MDEEKNAQSPLSAVAKAPRAFTFFGSYDHSIDGKGRIIIPNPYRKSLGETFTISITRDMAAIALYPDAVYDELMNELYGLNPRKNAVQLYKDHLAKMSYRDIQVDSQGRLVLPAKLRQSILGDAKDIEISGALDHIRIVSSEAASQEDSYFMEHRAEILKEIGDLNE